MSPATCALRVPRWLRVLRARFGLARTLPTASPPRLALEFLENREMPGSLLTLGTLLPFDRHVPVRQTKEPSPAPQLLTHWLREPESAPRHNFDTPAGRRVEVASGTLATGATSRESPVPQSGRGELDDFLDRRGSVGARFVTFYQPPENIAPRGGASASDPINSTLLSRTSTNEAGGGPLPTPDAPASPALYPAGVARTTDSERSVVTSGERAPAAASDRGAEQTIEPVRQPFAPVVSNSSEQVLTIAAPLADTTESVTTESGVNPSLSAQARIGFNHTNLDGWTVSVVGGTEEGRGSVRPGSALLEEGDSFLVGIEQPFVMPVNPASLVFTYTDLFFDTTDPDSINDAFEVSLVTATGTPLVHTFTTGRDAFFNITEEVGLATGPGVTETGGAVKTVTLDVSDVLPGTEATLRFRLVNNDQDTGTTVRILDVLVPSDNRTPELAPIADHSIPEGQPLAVTATFSDPDVGDSHTATVNWGDGTTSTATVVPHAGGGDISASHTYADDGVYAATVTVTDRDGATSEQTFQVTVANVAPTLNLSGAATVNEGGSYSLFLSSSDPGTDTIDHWTITWGDGIVQTVAGNPSAVSHTYADGLRAYTISATATDEDGTFAAANTVGVTVQNVAPALVAGLSFEAVPVAGTPQLRAVVTGRFTDPGFDSGPAGTIERFTTTVNWGDGTVETITNSVVQGAPGALTRGSFVAGHHYALSGVFTATVSVTDDDGGAATTSFTYGTVRIDVTSSINLNSNGVIPVKVFSDPGFDAATIDPLSLRFGPGGAAEEHGQLHGGGGFVMTHYRTQESRIRPGDTVAFLTGRLANGTMFVGMDTISIVHAPAVPPVSPPGATKFFVADAQADTAFRYATSGAATGSFTLDGVVANVRGVASTAAGDTVWLIDATTHAVAVQGANGSQLGSWTALGLSSPPDITTDGTDVWVVDAGPRQVLRYVGAASQRSGVARAATTFALHADNTAPSGLVTDGQILWVTDEGRDEVFVYDTVGAFLGRWRLDARNADASGITRDPTGASSDLWIVDRADRVVYTYTGGSAWRDGNRTASSTFALAAGNTQPEGIADPPGDFVSLLGELDYADGSSLNSNSIWLAAQTNEPSPFNSLHTAPKTIQWTHTGLPFAGPATLTFSLWDLDNTFEGVQLTSFTLNGVSQPVTAFEIPIGNEVIKWYSFPVDAGLLVGGSLTVGLTISAPPAGNEVGIDFSRLVVTPLPPTVAIQSPVDGSEFAVGTLVLVQGQAVGGSRGNPVRSVTISGHPVEALDPAGNFFTRVAVAPGENHFSVIVTDTLGQSAAASLTLTGIQPSAGAIDFTTLAELAPNSFVGEYGRTSWHDATNLLHAELAVRNTGQYPIGAPLLVGITNISDPTVRVRNPDGLTPDGIPYFDFSALVAGGLLAPGQVSGTRGVTFFDPNRVQFTYDLVFLGRLNQAPAITSVPDVEAVVGRPYSYAVTATDPDGDPLAFALVTAPTGMTIDATTGLIAWNPTTTNIGTPDVRVRVQDGRGGSAEQRYALSVIAPAPNRPPVFTSVPVVSATVGSAYTYQATATDEDGDPLTFALVGGPSGLSVNGTSGVVNWTPTAAQAGPQSVTLRVSDGHGGTATQTFSVRVEQVVGNHAPVIVTDPVTTAAPGQTYRYDVDAIDPDNDSLTYSLPAAPYGMSINSETGVISWPIPSASPQFGFAIRAGAANGSSAFRYETPHAIASDSAGNVYITGEFMGTADFDPSPGTVTLTSAGDVDVFVAKYSPSGALVWAKRMGSNGADVGIDIAIDRAGNVITTGNFLGTVDFDPGVGTSSLVSAGNADAFVLKLDASGNFLWANRWGGAGDEAGRGVAVDSNGSVYAIGHLRSTQVDFDPGPGTYPLSTVGGNDVVVTKFDNAGDLVWARRVGGTSDDFGERITLDAAGGVYLTGYFQGTADFDPGAGAFNLSSAGGSLDVFALKLTSAGDFVWALAMGGTGTDSGWDIAVDASGSVYAAGSFTGTADFDPGAGSFNLTSAGAEDVFVSKLDSAGSFVWARRMGGTGSDCAYGVVVDRSGNVYTSGSYQATADFDPGSGVFNLVSSGPSSSFASKLNGSGDFLWAGSLGGFSNGGGQDLLVDPRGAIYVTGAFTGTTDFDPGPGTYNLTAEGPSDIFLARLNQAPAFPDVTARVEDGRGGSDTQSFTIDLSNHAPEIVTDPVTTATPGRPYTYDVNATDSDADPLAYSLTQAPTGMTIDAASGVISWAVPPVTAQFVYSLSAGLEPGQVNVSYDTTTDGAGNVYVVGFFNGTADFDPGPGVYALTAAGEDAYVAKYTAAGALVWAKRFGGSGIGGNGAVALDSAGNVFVTGNVHGTYDLDPGPGVFNLFGSHAAYVVKLTSAGDFLWARGFSSETNATGIATDAAGNVYCVGGFQGTFDIDPTPGDEITSNGNSDTYVAKFSSAGSLVWSRGFGGSSLDEARDVATDADGSVYLIGAFRGTVDFDPGAGTSFLTSTHFQDDYVQKLNSGGGFVWAKRLGGTDQYYPRDQEIEIDVNGDVVIASAFTDTADFDPGPGTFNLTSNGGTDVYAAKLDAAGNFLWARAAGGTGDDWGEGLDTDQSGAIYVCGPFLGTVDFDPGPGSSVVTATTLNRLFVWKLTGSGDLAWAVASRGGGNALAVDTTGDIYLTGYVVKLRQDIDPQTVTVRVEDGRGGSDTQSFTIDVRADLNRDPVLRPVYDRTVRAGMPLEFALANSGLRAGELLIGSVTTPKGQVKRVNPVTGLQEVLFEEVRQTIQNEHLRPNFIPNALILDWDGHFLTNSPISGNDLTLYSGYRVNPADGTRAEPLFYRVLTQLPSGNYLVQERSDSGLSEHNPVTGFVRTVTGAVIGPPGAGGVALAHLPTGEPLIDPAGNVFIVRETLGLYRLNLSTGLLTLVDAVEGTGHGVAALNERYLAVASAATRRVYRIDLVTGQRLVLANDLVNVWGVTVGENGMIYVSIVPSPGDSRIVAIDPVTFQQTVVSSGQIQGVAGNHFRPLFGVSRFAALGGYDPDGDPLTFSMTGLPAGATFDPATKTFRWTPTTEQGGTFVVTSSLSDGRGGISTQTFRVTVVGGSVVNRPPQFTSTPPGAATVGQLLRYNTAAADADGDALTFDLAVKPVGMAVDPTTGIVVWVPTADQVGGHDVTLRVRDGRGGVALQSFRVTAARPNVTPVITSTPTGPAVVALPWRYQVAAQDADGDTLVFSLSGPAGMSIDPATGLVSWTPAAAQVGTRHVAITASDGRGASTAQSFDLPVVATAPNGAPAITSAPRFSIRIGDTYLYQVVATDPNGDPLTYTLDTAPAGMAINATGLVSWTPTATQLGANAVTVRVADGRGGFATQGFTVQVVTQATNHAPTITSAPPAVATVGRLYAYNLTGTDPDGDPLLWTLDSAPAGMSIDPRLGTLRWTPTADQFGSQSVVVRAIDGQGGYATQSFTVTVRAVNVSPGITSAPPTTAAVGQAYSYPVRASDPDADPLTFSLTSAPAGMTIDPATGLVRWTPTAAQTGNRSVTVRVEDGQGGFAEQSFTVVVSATAANRPPVVTSTPPLAATAAQPYSYSVAASDPDGDSLLYSLLAAPSGMTINPTTGLVAWTPTIAQVGLQSVTVAAIDPSGAGGTQTFSIAVADDNRTPTITSSPVPFVTAGLAYRYDVRASDPDGDPITYRLTQAPVGMTVDGFGRITWNSAIPNIGTHRVAVTVEDHRGAFVTQTFDMVVLADVQTPRVNLLIDNNPVNVGSPVTFVVLATDNVGVAVRGLTINGTPVALDAGGRVTLLAEPAGNYAVVAFASDAAGNTGLASTTLSVIDTSDAIPPDVDITAPTDGAVITAPVNVVGTATDANLVSYVLEVAPTDTGVFTEFASGTASVASGVLGRFDPSGLANGSYTIRLRATDVGGNESSIETSVEVAGDLKVGNFTLSFTDLSIPVSGIPVTLARTYDTLQAARQDDFGFGWRMEFRDTDLRTSLAPTGQEEYGVYNAFRDGTRVYVTLPGGRREGFTFHPQLVGGFGGTFAFYNPVFESDPGVTDRLSVPDNVTLIFVNGGYYSLNTLPYNPADTLNFAGRYTVTTNDGLAYTIDAVTGDLLTVADTLSNTLTFTDTAVTSSAGPSVTFARDPQGRITAVTDPAGNTIRYRYDLAGDLVAVTDRAGNETQFVYAQPGRPHYLTEVIDPLGQSGVRTEYDDQGRLIRLIDAAGNPVQLAHDPDNFLETVTDALGHSTTFEYDVRGNVITEVDAAGGITRRTYDDNNNVLTETDPLLRTRSFTYDGSGNALTETDALGNVTRNTYATVTPGLFASIRGARPVTLLTATTDPLGNSTTNAYSGVNLVSTTDAAGNVTHFAYDSAGNQTSITDAAGAVTGFQYDGRGNLTVQTDALGHATVYTYDDNGNQLTQTTTLTTPGGVRTLTTATTYDPNGRPLTVTDAEGHTTETEYDELGRQVATIDALDRRTEFVYDERGQLTRVDFADGTFTLTDYDAAGRRTSSTDRGGQVTHFGYDVLGRLTETIYPDSTPLTLTDNPRTRTEYDAAGQVLAQIDERGNRTEFGYDDAGRQTVVRDALGHETLTAHDPAGRTVSTTDALDHTTQFDYDDLGRQITTVFVDGTTTGTGYDALGRVISRTDQLGRTTQYEYDDLGRLTAVVDALDQRTEYGYDEAGNLVTQRDANTHITRYEYDGLGRRIATVLPLGQRSETDFDAVGNVEEATDFNGETILYEYDDNNRLTAKHLPGGSVSFTYTPDGQRETVTDARGETRYAYDERNRLVSRTDPDGTAIAYTYDAAGNRTSVTTPAGTTNYTFDERNRTATVTDPQSGVTEYEYNAVGNLVRTDLPNGTFETREFDDLNRLVFLENRGPGGVISSYTYTLAATGRRDQVVEDSGRRVNYGYDALDRLTGETITDSSAGNRTFGYTYDPVGNRLTRTDTLEGTTLYVYDANDRLLTETRGSSVTAYAYAANGNTLSKDAGPTDHAVYSWDAENRLISADVTDANGTKHIENRYDADGIRVSQTVDGAETRFLIDTVQPYAQVVLEYRPSGLVLVSYVYGNDLISQLRGGAKSFYHVDGLGSTRALTNAAGVVSDRYVYEAFGRAIGGTGTTINNYLFAGEQRDAGLGLDYLRARYLSVGTGRFYGMDSLFGLTGQPLTLHRFLYAVGDPFNKVDASGKWSSGLSSLVSPYVHGLPFFDVHQEAVDDVLTFLPDDERDILKNQLESMDRFQDLELQYLHAMRAPDQESSEARSKANAWVAQQLTLARQASMAERRHTALVHLGNAMHTLQDATSPVHVGFQEYSSQGIGVRSIVHALGEIKNPGPGSDLYRITSDAYFYLVTPSLPGDFFTGISVPPNANSVFLSHYSNIREALVRELGRFSRGLIG